MKPLAALMAALICSLQLQAFTFRKPPARPRNIILMIGDGTGLAHLYTAYTAAGGQLSIYEFASFVGLSITASADDYVTDSAAGATAISTGVKTNNGMIGVAPDSASLPTISEIAAQNGLSTGTVVACELPHATPASFYAHQPSRKMYPQIARDMTNNTATIMIGGGLPYFDTAALKARGFAVSIGSDAMRLNQGKRQVCFYNGDSSVSRASVRGNALSDGSLHALSLLSQNRKGFFLMIEGSQIDWGAHDNDSAYVVEEALDFDRTAAAVLQWARNDGNTLVIITADHECGGLTLHGYDSLNRRATMNFSTGHHTAEPVPVYAFGPGAEAFAGVYQNTEIYHKMMKLLRLKAK